MGQSPHLLDRLRTRAPGSALTRLEWSLLIGVVVCISIAVCALGPLVPIVLVVGAGAGALLVFGPSRLMLAVFIGFMVTSQEYRSLVVFPFGGVEWHPRELVLILLLAHALVKLLRAKAHYTPDITHLLVLTYMLFFVQIVAVGCLRGAPLSGIIGEARFAIFLAAYPVFVALIRTREDLHFYAKLVLVLTVFVALAALLTFAILFVMGRPVSVQDGWGAFVSRRVGPLLIPTVRPRGHMYYEIVITVLVSLFLCPGESRKRRLLYVCIISLLLAALLVMFMRTAAAALAASLAFLVFVRIRSPRRQAFIGVVVLACAILALLFVPALFEALTSDTAGGADVSVKGRLVELRTVYEAFPKHPLVGAGAGSHVVMMGFEAKTSRESYAESTYNMMHDVFLYFAFKGGIVGLLLACSALVALLVRGFVLIQRMSNPLDRAFACGLVAAFGGQLVATMAMPRMTYPCGHVFLALIACAFVILAHPAPDSAGAIPSWRERNTEGASTPA